AVARAGASELRIYHAGLATPADLDAIRELCRTTREVPGPVPAGEQPPAARPAPAAGTPAPASPAP
ncbi:MAG: hypothetical protein ACM32E_14705, partial [Gemmatimonadota bacterium]